MELRSTLCNVVGTREMASFDISLNVEMIDLKHSEQGILHVRRQLIKNSLDDARCLGKVIEKALRKKVPKLVSTPADKRILLLERQPWCPSPA